MLYPIEIAYSDNSFNWHIESQIDKNNDIFFLWWYDKTLNSFDDRIDRRKVVEIIDNY